MARAAITPTLGANCGLFGNSPTNGGGESSMRAIGLGEPPVDMTFLSESADSDKSGVPGPGESLVPASVSRVMEFTGSVVGVFI